MQQYTPTSSLALVCVVLFVLGSCANVNLKQEALRKSNLIVELLASDSVLVLFPKTYFAQEDILFLSNDMKVRCDYKNRQGGFVRDVYEKKLGIGLDKVSFIYEYALKCDSMRLILTFELKPDPEPIQISVEPIKKRTQPVISTSDLFSPRGDARDLVRGFISTSWRLPTYSGYTAINLD